ncbi:hypothetical protein V6V47_02315 [Micromonospora sp. CPCC 205539]|uniref:hypothetical protein n=1 Tax=Micromonospora sp. CPCC 205539 TaxID=3122408 RepID=UPI002FF04569
MTTPKRPGVIDRRGVTVGDGTTQHAVRRSIDTRARQWLLAITLLAGLLAAVALTAAMAPADRSFALLSEPVQSLMSVATPLFGILLVRDLRQTTGTVRITPTLLAVALPAAVIGVFGVLVCAATLALAPADIADQPWRHAGTIAVGSVLTQLVAGLVGVGLGLLLRSPVVAFLATIVLPLGTYALLGAVDALRPAQPWLTPYGSLQYLLSGDMSALRWAQWLTVVLIWNVGLVAAGLALFKRHGQSGR